jgi:hypothetical protein
MYQRGSHWTDLREIWFLRLFMKICREIQTFFKIWAKMSENMTTCKFSCCKGIKSPLNRSIGVKCEAVKVAEQV